MIVINGEEPPALTTERKLRITTIFYISFMTTPFLFGFIAGYLAYLQEPASSTLINAAGLFACGAILTWTLTTIHWVRTRKDTERPTGRWLTYFALFQTPCVLTYLIVILMIMSPDLF